MFGLIDCNNFFVSCERVFRPDLEGQPVGVLSNNDGCFVARSNELKALGVPMGAPAFQYQNIITQHNVVTFSANFHLYADISRRVMNIIRDLVPRAEIYSIDEAFIDLKGIHKPLVLMKKIKSSITQSTGIPVSIGIGKTKTLAKAASEHAKHTPETQGVLWINDTNIAAILNTITVSDVWGVGRQYSKLLISYGITTAKQLQDTDDAWIKNRTSVSLQRTVWELRGIPCMDVAEHTLGQKTLVCSRTFGTPLETKQELLHAIAGHVEKAAEKLRQQNLVTQTIKIYIRTNYHNKHDPQYMASREVQLPIASAYTPTLLRAAHEALDVIYAYGYRYKHAGVVCLNLLSQTETQLNLLLKPPDIPKERALMKAVDHTNQKWGRHTVGFASNYRNHTKYYNQRQCSPAYTTNWEEIPKIMQ